VALAVVASPQATTAGSESLASKTNSFNLFFWRLVLSLSSLGMCLDPNQPVPQDAVGHVKEVNGHRCYRQCRLCWAFSKKEDYEHFSQGHTLQLGLFQNLVALALSGCRFCAGLYDGMVRLAGGEVRAFRIETVRPLIIDISGCRRPMRANEIRKYNSMQRWR